MLSLSLLVIRNLIYIQICTRRPRDYYSQCGRADVTVILKNVYRHVAFFFESVWVADLHVSEILTIIKKKSTCQTLKSKFEGEGRGGEGRRGEAPKHFNSM